MCKRVRIGGVLLSTHHRKGGKMDLSLMVDDDVVNKKRREILSGGNMSFCMTSRIEYSSFIPPILVSPCDP